MYTGSDQVLEDYDLGMLHEYSLLFPTSHLAKMIHAYFGYMEIQLDEEDEGVSRPKRNEEDEPDYIEIMMVCPTALLTSRFPQRCSIGSIL